jgi:hypothetical protein
MTKEYREAIAEWEDGLRQSREKASWETLKRNFSANLSYYRDLMGRVEDQELFWESSSEFYKLVEKLDKALTSGSKS